MKPEVFSSESGRAKVRASFGCQTYESMCVYRRFEVEGKVEVRVKERNPVRPNGG